MTVAWDGGRAGLWIDRNAWWAVVLLSYCWIAGCGARDYELETAPVAGRVTLDGNPIDRGTILFISSRGRSSSGEIQSDGTFQLSTYGENDGAIVGENKVAVFIASGNELDQTPAASLRIADRYGSASTSGLVFEVKAGQSNDFPVELKSK